MQSQLVRTLEVEVTLRLESVVGVCSCFQQTADQLAVARQYSKVQGGEASRMQDGGVFRLDGSAMIE